MPVMDAVMDAVIDVVPGPAPGLVPDVLSGSSASLVLLASLGVAAAVALLLPGRPPSAALLDAVLPGRRTNGGDGPPDAGTGAAQRSDDGGSAALRWVATVAVGLGVLFFVGGTRGVPVALGAASLCWWLAGRLEPPAVRRRRERLAAAVPHAVDLMSACLSAGLSPSAAVEQIAVAVDEPLAGELGALTHRFRLGVDPARVWRDLGAHPQLGALGRTVSRAVDSGASVADAMLRLSEDLRRTHRAEVESRARSVGVKAALPLGVCLLPAFVLVGVVPLVAGSVSVLVR